MANITIDVKFQDDQESSPENGRRKHTTPLNKPKGPATKASKPSFNECCTIAVKILYWLLYLVLLLWIIEPVIKSAMFRRCKLACKSRDLLLFFYFVVLVLFGFVLVANQYIDTQHGESSSENSVINITVFGTELYVTVLMFLSVAFIVIFWAPNATASDNCEEEPLDKADDKKEKSPEKGPVEKFKRALFRLRDKCRSQSLKTAISENSAESDQLSTHSEDKGEHSIVYLMGSVYVFASGSFLLMIFEIADFFHCGLHYSSGTNLYSNYRVHFAFFLIMLIFFSGQVFFLRRFFTDIEEIPGQTEVKFFLVHLLATNVVLSSFFVAQESGIFLGGSGKNHNIENLTCYGTDRNQSDFVHDTLHDLKEYLEPFVIEYILIVAGLLYSVLLHISKRKHQQKMKEVYSGIPNHKPVDQSLPSREQGYSMGKTGPDVKGSRQSSDRCDKIDSVVQKLPKSRKHQSQTYFLFVIGIIMSITMIVSSWSLGDDKHYTTLTSLKPITASRSLCTSLRSWCPAPY